MTYYGEDPESGILHMEGTRPMEAWRKVWREGVATCLSNEGLMVLRRGLAEDDPRLIQGCTTAPPPLQCVQDWPVEAGCALSYAVCYAEDSRYHTVGEVEEQFARMCFEIDQRLGEPAGCRWFLNFWDETPRDDARHLLLEEVDRELRGRGA